MKMSGEEREWGPKGTGGKQSGQKRKIGAERNVGRVENVNVGVSGDGDGKMSRGIVGDI